MSPFSWLLRAFARKLILDHFASWRAFPRRGFQDNFYLISLLCMGLAVTVAVNLAV